MSGKLFKNGVQSNGDIVAINKDLRTRTGNTGGGDVLTRSVKLGPAGFVYITDTSGTAVGYCGPDAQPAAYWVIGGGTGPGGALADPFNVDLATGEIIVGTAGQFSASAYTMSFRGPSGESVGYRIYLIKSSTTYAVDIDGNVAFSATQSSFSVSGSLAAGTVTYSPNVGQSAEINKGTVGSTTTIYWASGACQRLTLTSATACTISMTAPLAIGWYTLKTISPASGTVPAITWPATVKWASGTKPTQATTLGRANVQRFYWDGTNYWGDAIVNAA